jgi:hypothetical protein
MWLKAIPPFEWIYTFVNTPEEWHAFVNGFCEVLCPWPPRYEASDELLQEIEDEFHYYQFGRSIGVLAWVGIIALLKAIFT